MNSYKRKKGQILDLMVFGLFAVVIAIAFLFLIFFINTVSSSIQDSDEFGNASKNYLNRTSETLPNVMDGSFAFFVVLSGIGLIASAALIDTSLIFIAITLPIFGVLIFANLIFINMIHEFGSSPAMLATYNTLPMMQFFAAQWLNVVIVIGILSIVAFFGGKTLR